MKGSGASCFNVLICISQCRPIPDNHLLKRIFSLFLTFILVCPSQNIFTNTAMTMLVIILKKKNLFIFNTLIQTQMQSVIMTNEKLCLKWNNFQNIAQTSFAKLRGDDDFTDVTLACQDQSSL